MFREFIYATCFLLQLLILRELLYVICFILQMLILQTIAIRLGYHGAVSGILMACSPRTCWSPESFLLAVVMDAQSREAQIVVIMCNLQRSEVLVAIVLLLGWSSQLPSCKKFDLLDLFAGQANASAHWCLALNRELPATQLASCACRATNLKLPIPPRRSKGHTVGTIDIQRGACMNFNTDAGFAQLGPPFPKRGLCFFFVC